MELRLANGRNGGPDEVMVFVMDPVANTLTTWVSGAPESQHPPRIASMLKMPGAPRQGFGTPMRPASPPEDGRPQPIITTESLGTQSIEGLEASGERTTTIVPAGRSGNSAPITKTHEVWRSPDLQLIVKQQWTDPRVGVRTVELKNISRKAPDPAIFQPPSGYEVKDTRQTLRELEEKLGAMQN